MPPRDLRKTVGQLFAVGFHGTGVGDEIRSLIQDYGVGAVVLFKRNVEDAQQLRSLCCDLQTVAREAGHEQPLFIGVDQENGLVARVSPPVAAQLPGPMTIGATHSLDAAHGVAVSTGEMLRYFGIIMNYAPVADINSEPLNPVIGVRSPGDDPAKVSQFATAFARGLRESRVAPCIKHFPGHGDTAVDSHYGLPVVDKARADLDKTELVPFRDAAAQDIEMVMTAHISLPGLGGPNLPATLSPEILAILRKDYNYSGVIMTDCLEMDGIRATYGAVEGALMAFQAGVDNIMICHTYEIQTAAVDRICAAIEAGIISHERLEESLNRLKQLKCRFTNWNDALETRSSDALQEINSRAEVLAKSVYSNAATLVRSKPGLLPLPRTARTVFLSPGPDVPVGGAVDSGDASLPTRVPWVSHSFGDVLRAYNPAVEDIRFTGPDLSPDEWKQVDEAEAVILSTRNAKESPYQRDLGLEVSRRLGSKALVAIATCAPYDFLDDMAMDTYLAVYEPTVEAFRSGVAIVYGAETAVGKLPVAFAGG